MQLKGKTALISGAARNNGKAIAQTFAREGADVILVAKSNGELLNGVAKDCESAGRRALPLLADMTDPAQVDNVVKQGLEKFGRIDVAVSAVGMRPHKLIIDFTYEEWLAGFALNCHSLFLLTKFVAPGMKQHGGGSIIALGGQMTIKTAPNSGLVVASKHGLWGLAKNLARELGPDGIRVNLVNPGRIENVRANPEWYTDKLQSKGQYSEEEIKRIPQRRVGKNQEIANAALFLASDQSSYVSGDSIFVAGGQQIM